LTGERHNLDIDRGGGVLYFMKGVYKMPANQKYSTRIHSRRQLGRSIEHLMEASKVLSEVGQRYSEALPIISNGCIHIVDLLGMVEVLIEDMRTNI